MTVERITDKNKIEDLYGRMMFAKNVTSCSQMMTWLGISDGDPEIGFWLALHDPKTDSTSYIRLQDENIQGIQMCLAMLEKEKAGRAVS